LFEKEEDIKNPSIWISLGVSNLQEVQAVSRYKVANISNIIIPGHGPPFHVTDNIRKQLAKQLEEMRQKR
jgi:hypothetical protein